jgi:mycofactocin system glycosyltransferase
VTPVPPGFRLVPDRSTRIAGDVVWGGTTVLRLTPAGTALAHALLTGTRVSDRRSGLMARRLLDAGLAHPTPPAGTVELEVVVPARDRADLLDACLASLDGLAVTVVDDASRKSGAVAEVARGHGAQVVLRARNGGPAAARNTGVEATTAQVVAFVDSDAVVDPEVLRQLAAHLSDPAVAAATPRVDDPLLDMGAQPANVKPGSRVSYVPATVLVVRRTAFDDVGGFDEALRYGEDVDLVWRLIERGWSVRYDPTVSAAHSCDNRLARRFAYGSSVGPLSQRHVGALRGPALAGMLAPLRIRTFLRTGLPATAAVQIAATAPVRTAVAIGRWAVPASADDVAYTLGVWRGCLSSRNARPLLPRLR